MGIRSFLHRLTAPKTYHPYSGGDVKTVFLVNHSLKMGKGKIAAQVGHASVGVVLNAGQTHPAELEAWLAQGQKKVCLKCDTLEQMELYVGQANSQGIHTHVVEDAGHTQIPRGSTTVAAIGPCAGDVLDTITGELKLL